MHFLRTQSQFRQTMRKIKVLKRPCLTSLRVSSAVVKGTVEQLYLF
jgi:hypothetical protein